MAPILDVVDLSSEGESERLVSTATTTGTSEAHTAGTQVDMATRNTGIKEERRREVIENLKQRCMATPTGPEYTKNG